MIRGNSALRAQRGLLAWVLAALAALPITAVLAATQYLYDDLGRLVLAANADGSATVYAHDENGNVVTIINWAASGPVIAGFSPMQGHAGTPVTIFGAGFSATPAENTVTIGGLAAAVSSSTTTTIQSSIPQNANTGPITVTVGGATAVSANNITVYKPIIGSFSPSLVAPGGSVTVIGASLNLVSGGTTLSVGGTAVTPTSLSNTQAVFNAPNTTGGLIAVNTSYGQATSAASLVIVPNAVGVANVVDHDPVDPNGPSQSLAINQQNKTALLSFQAAASSFYSVQLDAFTLAPSGGSISYTVYGPTGASFASGNVSTTARSIHLPQTTSAGRYLVAFNSGLKTSVQITARVDLNTVLTPTGTTVPSSTTGTYQSQRFIFTATAGDDLAIALTDLVVSPSPSNQARVNVLRPDNYTYWPSAQDCYTTAIPGCSFALTNVPFTGTYHLFVESVGATTVSAELTLSTDLGGTLTPGGASTTLTFDVPGRQALLTFTATAGQNMAFRLSALSTTPAGTGYSYLVYQPNGSPVTGNNNLTTATTVNLSYLPVTGTYTVWVAPRNAATGSVQLTFVDSTLGTLTANGSTQNFSTTLPNQHAYFTFTANAGDDLGLALTNVVTTPNPPNSVRLWIVLPSGYALIYGEYCSTSTVPGCSWNLFNLPETGTYRLSVDATGEATHSFSLTLSPHVVSTLTPGTPQNVTLDVPGEHALLTFAATAGQNATLHLNGVTTTPAGKSLTMMVYNPSGSAISSPSTTSQTTLSLQGLSAGTYSVVLVPQHASLANATITLAQEVGGSVTTGSATQTYSTNVPQQHAYFTFSAAAGDDVGLAITNLAITPSTSNVVRIWVVPPSGYPTVYGSYCYTSTVPGCSFNLMNLEAGIHRVTVESMSQSTMTFGLTLTPHSVGTIAAGTPQNVTLDAPGKHALLTFTATAGQAAALHLSSPSTAPAGKPVTMYVYNPSGTVVASPQTTTQTTANLSNLVAGTYSVVIGANDAATGSATVTLANGVSGTLPANGTTQSFATGVPNQHANFTFTATAGEDLGLAITNLVLTPNSPNYVKIWVSPAAGYPVVWGSNCSSASVPGCAYNLFNLPYTGTYTVTVESMGMSTMTFDLTLSADSTGTLTVGAPSPVTLAVPGKAALLSFTATAGQTAALHLGSVTTTPAAKPVSMYVYNPSAQLVYSPATATQTTLNMTNLVAGTYSVVVQASDGATGSAAVTFANALGGVLPANGTTQSFAATVPQQHGYFTFTANAGDDLGFALTNLVLTPSTPNNVRVWIGPAGGYPIVWGSYCYTTAAPGCTFALLNVPSTGTYDVTIESMGQNTAAFDLTLSPDVTGALTLGTPLGVTLDSPGEQAWLSFTATAGQNVVLTKSSIATTPSGKAIWTSVYSSAGGQIANTTNNTINLNNLSAGTYQVLIHPADGATATLQVGVQ